MRAVHGEHARRSNSADQQRVGAEQVEKRAGELRVCVERDAEHGVADRHAEEQRGQQAEPPKKPTSQTRRQRGDSRLLRNSIDTARKISAKSSSMKAR